MSRPPVSYIAVHQNHNQNLGINVKLQEAMRLGDILHPHASTQACDIADRSQHTKLHSASGPPAMGTKQILHHVLLVSNFCT